MQLVTITQITAEADGVILVCQCIVSHEDNSTENIQFVYSPDDPYSGDFGRQVKQWLIDNEGAYTIDPYVPPEPVAVQSKPYLWAAAYECNVSEGIITGIEAASQLVGALYLDVGLYMVFFAQSLPDTNYYPKLDDGAVNMKTIEKSTDYFMMSVTDVSGNPVDPETFSIEIMRMQ